jgi:ABC-2 type transport system permease protein
MKIVKKNLPSMMIYVVVFLGISMLFAANATKTQPTSFSSQKASVAFISEENSTLIDGFKQELSKNAVYVNIPDETEKLQDALYFRNVTCIIRIPKGFTQAFMRGEDVQIQKTVVPNSVSNAYIDISINQYLNDARLYVKNIKGITQEELVRHLKTDLTVNTPVDLKNVQASTRTDFTVNYFNYLSYALFSVLILGISAIMLVFNNKDLSRRNFCSPVSAGRMNLQFILANFVFTLSCWAIMVGVGTLMDIRHGLNGNFAYFLLNSIIFTLCASSISFLIGNMLKNRSAISAVCNVVTLGPCFISGVFVPQELLSDNVLKIASFTPTYWFVKANNQIASLTNLNASNLRQIFYYMLIEFGFALAFFAVSLAVGKKKRMSSN